MQQVIDMMNRNEELLFQRWEGEVASPNFLTEEDKRKTFQIIFSQISQSENEAVHFFEDLIDRHFREEECLKYLVASIQQFKRTIIDAMEDSASSDELYEKTDSWFDPMIAELVNICTDCWHEAYRKQDSMINELSAPIIPISKDVCILPLIGAVHDERAAVIIENLLHSVKTYQCRYVIMEITGVPVVDTYVANHLIQAADAVKLLGAQCMIVGIRPEIAQTLINLGVSMDSIQTFSNLQTGLRFIQMKEK
ncbi:STAS domain-containing protein [Metabacillus indicus]|uniref:STAS domain-containing protein n=1 Tax=Metabacillus indicus TaxID=246786 RepID=UPI0024915F9E|nr:STAS domain-containing protein [Metabacillus indicus]